MQIFNLFLNRMSVKQFPEQSRLTADSAEPLSSEDCAASDEDLEEVLLRELRWTLCCVMHHHQAQRAQLTVLDFVSVYSPFIHAGLDRFNK